MAYTVSVTHFNQFGQQSSVVEVEANEYTVEDGGTLHLYKNNEVGEGVHLVASFAPGRWNSVQKK